MRVVISVRAEDNLSSIQRYLSKRNPPAARNTVQRLRQAIDLLADFPSLGPAWKGSTRAMTVTGLPYRVHYRIEEAADRVVVITVAHVRQRPPV